jgi:hypothetical protein
VLVAHVVQPSVRPDDLPHREVVAPFDCTHRPCHASDLVVLGGRGLPVLRSVATPTLRHRRRWVPPVSSRITDRSDTRVTHTYELRLGRRRGPVAQLTYASPRSPRAARRVVGPRFPRNAVVCARSADHGTRGRTRGQNIHDSHLCSARIREQTRDEESRVADRADSWTKSGFPTPKLAVRPGSVAGPTWCPTT